MSLWSRLFGRYRAEDQAPLPMADILVEDPRRSATRLGETPRIMPWSATRLAGIFEDLARNPGYSSLIEARLARQCLSQFWLSAPVDQLQTLYRTPIGDCYRLMLSGTLARETLLPEEESWRDILTQRLITAFDRPETTNVLLAAMPYFVPGKMRVADPLQQVPDWLQEDYARLFDQQLLQRIARPIGLLGPAGQAYGAAPRLGTTLVAPPSQRAQAMPPAPAPLPQLASRRGNEALALVQSQEYQNRMNGLINLHVIDPQDGQVQRELTELRRQLGQIWLDARPDQLEQLYASKFGRLYRDLMASGFPNVPLDQQERLLRNQLARLVADMSQPGAISALLAVLPFYGHGKLAFGGGEQHIPGWLLGEITTIYGQSPRARGSAAPAPSGGIPST